MIKFELEIIHDLLIGTKYEGMDIAAKTENEKIEYSGAGYFITLCNPIFSLSRLIFDNPNIQGKLGGISVGYLAFMENEEFILECFAYEKEISPLHRELGFVRLKT